jgi:hypothetical protein
MKFNIGDIIYSDYYNEWGFVSKLQNIRAVNKTKWIFIWWFRTGEQSKYPIGCYAYSTFKKVEDKDEI